MKIYFLKIFNFLKFYLSIQISVLFISSDNNGLKFSRLLFDYRLAENTRKRNQASLPQYFVLIIITPGSVDDLRETIQVRSLFTVLISFYRFYYHLNLCVFHI